MFSLGTTLLTKSDVGTIIHFVKHPVNIQANENYGTKIHGSEKNVQMRTENVKIWPKRYTEYSDL